MKFFYALYLAILSFCSILATALTIPTIPTNGTISPPSLAIRQTSSCGYYGVPYNSWFNSCQKDLSCICGPVTAALLYATARCELDTMEDVWSRLSDILNQYASDCAAAGYPIDALRFSSC